MADSDSDNAPTYVKSHDHKVSSLHEDGPQLNVGGHGGTQRRLRNYQVTMIGFCSGIGTGLFIGSGAAYAHAGPAGLLLSYSIVGIILWCVMQSIAELATLVSWTTEYYTARSMLIGLIVANCRVLSALGNTLH